MNEIGNQVGLSLSIINRAAQSYFTRELKHLEIGPGMQAYLLAIELNEVISQDILSKRLSVDKANVTRAMKSLEQLALIKRETDILDQRKTLISLTKKGSIVKNEIITISQKWIEILKSSLEEGEWNTFNNSLLKIIENLEDIKTNTK